MQNQRESKIIDLLYGKISYYETISPSSVCNKILGEVVLAEKNLLNKIRGDENLKSLLDAFMDCIEKLHHAENDHYFAEGFKTGLMIGIEAGGEWADNKIKY